MGGEILSPISNIFVPWNALEHVIKNMGIRKPSACYVDGG